MRTEDKPRWLLTFLFVASATGVVAQPVATENLDGDKQVLGCRIDGSLDRAEVFIRGQFEASSCVVQIHNHGRQVTIDINGAKIQGSGLGIEGSAPLITRSVTAQHARGVRIELTTAFPVEHRVRVVSGGVMIELSRQADSSFSTNHASPSSSEREVDVRVERIWADRQGDRERLLIQLSRGASFRMLSGGRIEIPEARLSDGISQKVVIEGGELLKGATIHATPRGVIVEAEAKATATSMALREGNKIVWFFTSAATSPSQYMRGRTIAREGDLREAVRSDGAEEEPRAGMRSDQAAAFLSDLPLQIDAAREGRVYRGRRIDLDFNNADIHNILRLLAEVGGVNIVTSDDVSGSVTIRMRNVPWDQALEVILQSKGLGMVRRGNLIRVAPLERLEKEREMAIARRKQMEELEPLETRIVPVSYANAGDLSERVSELLSPRGSVSVDARTNVLIVRDISSNLDDIEELVRALDTQTPQVLVEAKIVEASNRYTRDIGIQWGGDITMNTLTGNPTGLVFPANIGIAGGNYDVNTPTAGLSPFVRQIATPNFAVNLPASTGVGQGGAIGLTLGSIAGTVNLNVRLSAAEQNGVVRIISSPRVLTLDNYEARIAQGTLIPYSQISAQGVQTAFQEASLQLKVRPHVTADGSVAMHVEVSRDEPDFTRTSPRGEPAILKRSATTDLLIEDGHTAVIGGIYTRNTGRQVDQVPFFGDIPILGALFQRQITRDERNELLIFLTPRIVNRSEALRR
ncbi:MAG: type IV pilus secretin PilQ [Sandaracinaceae bacterium]|nr:type IV pilus secretin PilQ [Sandaracinaceae bacterium]